MGRPRLKKVHDEFFSFRIAKTDKERLETKINSKLKSFNKALEENRNKITKNDIIIEAMKIGLKQLNKKDLPYRKKKES